MAACVGSPFAASGTAQRLPDRKPKGRVVLRFISTTPATTDGVYIRIHPTQVVDTSHVDIYLKDGESVFIKPKLLLSMQDISVIVAAGAGNIFWGEI
jgi:hypothetical protein